MACICFNTIPNNWVCPIDYIYSCKASLSHTHTQKKKKKKHSCNSLYVFSLSYRIFNLLKQHVVCPSIWNQFHLSLSWPMRLNAVKSGIFTLIFITNNFLCVGKLCHNPSKNGAIPNENTSKHHTILCLR